MSKQRWLSAASSRSYSQLLKAYPRSFRSDHGGEMVDVFDAMIADGAQRSGALGIARVWFRVLPDFALSVAQQHALELQRRLAMARIFSDPNYLIPALAVAMFIGMVTTPADVGTMFVIGWPVYGIYLCGFVSTRLIRRAHPLALALGLLNVAFWAATLMLLFALGRAGQLAQGLLLKMVPWLLLLPPLTTALLVGATYLVLRRRTIAWASESND
jgi:hypothetical protein